MVYRTWDYLGIYEPFGTNSGNASSASLRMPVNTFTQKSQLLIDIISLKPILLWRFLKDLVSKWVEGPLFVFTLLFAKQGKKQNLLAAIVSWHHNAPEGRWNFLELDAMLGINNEKCCRFAHILTRPAKCDLSFEDRYAMANLDNAIGVSIYSSTNLSINSGYA